MLSDFLCGERFWEKTAGVTLEASQELNKGVVRAVALLSLSQGMLGARSKLHKWPPCLRKAGLSLQGPQPRVWALTLGRTQSRHLEFPIPGGNPLLPDLGELKVAMGMALRFAWFLLLKARSGLLHFLVFPSTLRGSEG